VDLKVDLHMTRAHADLEGYARLAAAIFLRVEGAAHRGALPEAA
jgi:hypothetical protein